MKKILILIFVVCVSLFCYSQPYVITQAAQSYKIPDNIDTVSVIMLVTDTTTNPKTTQRKFFNSPAFQVKGYMVIGGSLWYPIFLNEYKKKLASTLIVWNSIVTY